MRRDDWPLITHTLDDFSEPWSDPPAPVVLLHHGLGGNGRLFAPWVPYLADRYRVLRVTARGQGGTPRPAGYHWSLANFVQDVVDLLDHLEIERVHWVGTSGGGIVGQQAAISAPGRIASLALVATTARFRSPTARLDDWLAPLDAGDVAAFLRRDEERRFGTDHPARTDWIVAELCRTPARVAAELHRWVVGVDLTSRLPEIRCPALVVTGEHDTLTGAEDARVLVDGIPNARLHIVRGHPHNVGYTHPWIVAPIVRRFIDAVSSADDGSARSQVTAGQARAVAELAGLELPPGREVQLERTLSGFLAGMERLYAVDSGDAEPPVLTYDGEARP
jgi:pimeloyl-ACP methyl ester carboxylesterase